MIQINFILKGSLRNKDIRKSLVKSVEAKKTFKPE